MGMLKEKRFQLLILSPQSGQGCNVERKALSTSDFKSAERAAGVMLNLPERLGV